MADANKNNNVHHDPIVIDIEQLQKVNEGRAIVSIKHAKTNVVTEIILSDYPALERIFDRHVTTHDILRILDIGAYMYPKMLEYPGNIISLEKTVKDQHQQLAKLIDENKTLANSKVNTSNKDNQVRAIANKKDDDIKDPFCTCIIYKCFCGSKYRNGNDIIKHYIGGECIHYGTFEEDIIRHIVKKCIKKSEYNYLYAVPGKDYKVEGKRITRPLREKLNEQFTQDDNGDNDDDKDDGEEADCCESETS